MDSSTCIQYKVSSNEWRAVRDHLRAKVSRLHSLERIDRQLIQSYDKINKLICSAAFSRGVQRSSRNMHLGYCQSRAPLLFQDVQAYAAVAVDVGMIDLRLEVDLKALHWGRS